MTTTSKTEEVEISDRFTQLSADVKDLLVQFRRVVPTLSKGELIRVLKASVEHPVENTVKLISGKEKTVASLANRIMQDKVEMTLEYIKDMQLAEQQVEKTEEENNG